MGKDEPLRSLPRSAAKPPRSVLIIRRLDVLSCSPQWSVGGVSYYPTNDPVKANVSGRVSCRRSFHTIAAAVVPETARPPPVDHRRSDRISMFFAHLGMLTATRLFAVFRLSSAAALAQQAPPLRFGPTLFPAIMLAAGSRARSQSPGQPRDQPGQDFLTYVKLKYYDGTQSPRDSHQLDPGWRLPGGLPAKIHVAPAMPSVWPLGTMCNTPLSLLT